MSNIKKIINTVEKYQKRINANRKILKKINSKNKTYIEVIYKSEENEKFYITIKKNLFINLIKETINTYEDKLDNLLKNLKLNK